MAPPPFDPARPDAPARLAAAAHDVEALPRRRDQMLPALLAAQHALGWLPRAAIEQVAAHIRIPASEVYACVTGYSELRLDRPVPGAWRICTGPACDLAGAGDLLAQLDARLPGRVGPADCQFLCALAPVAADAGERLHGRVTTERVVALAAVDAGDDAGNDAGGVEGGAR